MAKPDLRRQTRNAVPDPPTRYEAATCKHPECRADIMRRPGQQWIHTVTGRVACVRDEEIENRP